MITIIAKPKILVERCFEGRHFKFIGYSHRKFVERSFSKEDTDSLEDVRRKFRTIVHEMRSSIVVASSSYTDSDFINIFSPTCAIIKPLSWAQKEIETISKLIDDLPDIIQDKTVGLLLNTFCAGKCVYLGPHFTSTCVYYGDYVSDGSNFYSEDVFKKYEKKVVEVCSWCRKVCSTTEVGEGYKIHLCEDCHNSWKGNDLRKNNNWSSQEYMCF
jgi:hypothetical protein